VKGKKLTKKKGGFKENNLRLKKVAPLPPMSCPTTLPRPPLNGIANWL